mmetsp:Transcript_1813/g.3427  ORF Transcript_1813/g.3427 Transcript_1813/m.3427 type:complete len:87 (-) Transcript_1813:31-291(-)
MRKLEKMLSGKGTPGNKYSIVRNRGGQASTAAGVRGRKTGWAVWDSHRSREDAIAGYVSSRNAGNNKHWHYNILTMLHGHLAFYRE